MDQDTTLAVRIRLGRLDHLGSNQTVDLIATMEVYRYNALEVLLRCRLAGTVYQLLCRAHSRAVASANQISPEFGHTGLKRGHNLGFLSFELVTRRE